MTDYVFTIARHFAADIAAGRLRVMLEGENDNFDGLNWESDTIPKPTREELDSLWLSTYAQRHEAERVNPPILAAIAEIEIKAARPMRELLLDPANDEARMRLSAFEGEIASLRNQLVR